MQPGRLVELAGFFNGFCINLQDLHDVGPSSPSGQSRDAGMNLSAPLTEQSSALSGSCVRCKNLQERLCAVKSRQKLPCPLFEFVRCIDERPYYCSMPSQLSLFKSAAA